MKPLSKTTVGVLYAFVHFALEVACFSFLFSRLSDDPLWVLLALGYDALAFLPQCLLGALLDRFPKLPAGVIGCVLVMAALLLPWDTAALVVIGIGNALVHIAGAQKTLTSTQGNIAPCGIFVGGGSFGVIAGQLLAKTAFPLYVWVPLVLMAAALAVVLFVAKYDTTPAVATGFSIERDCADDLLVTLMMAVVAARAYIGYAIPTEWNKTVSQTVMLFVSMGIGKMLGGVLADRIGYRKTAAFSLLVGLPFLLCGNRLMWVSLIGVGLFSMTMSLTVGVLVSRFSKMPCFSFGVTTVALFLGTVPAFFVRPTSMTAHVVIVSVLSVTVFSALWYSVKKGC